MTTPLAKMVFSVPELAEMAGLHRDRMRRMLVSAKVPFDRNGRAIVVHAIHLRDAAPALWDGLAMRFGQVQAPAARLPGFEAALAEVKQHIIEIERCLSASPGVARFEPMPWKLP